jgi:hypothetical protein
VEKIIPDEPSYPYTSRGERGNPVPIHRNDHDVTNSVQTTDPAAVAAEIIRLYHGLFPHASARPFERAFTHLARAYDGGDLSYWPCDTEYHDIQHVLDVTLAMARLMDGYQKGRTNGSRSKGDEALRPELFVGGALAALFHDFGYLRSRSDRRHQFGAEYTIGHVSRGATFVRRYMRELGYDENLARLAATLLHFTGYERKAETIRIGAGLPRRLGQMMGTADIIAQMSDRCYLEKCRNRLFPEFVLGRLGAPRRAQKLPLFASGDELVAKTPGFFENAMKRLDVQLGRCHQYAARHFGGENLYLDAVHRNVSYAGSPAPHLRRQPPYTLLPEVQPYPRDLVRVQ